MDQDDRYDASLLMVDDHDGVRGAVCDWLAASFPGLRIQQARDAEEALRAVDTVRFDVVLMDIGLPGISGIEATRQLRARAPGSQIVMISVHDSEAHRKGSLAAGAVAFVAKRRMHEGLRKVLERLLAKRATPNVAGERMA